MSTIVYDASKNDRLALVRDQQPIFPDRYSCSEFREELPKRVDSAVVPILVPLTKEQQLERDALLRTLLGRISQK